MIKAVIFDMDGVLIDSEPLWQQTEVDVLNEVGVNLTPEMQIPTKGLRTDEMVNYWYTRYPWKKPTPEELIGICEERMVQVYKKEVELMEGAEEAIHFFMDLNLPIALASSSANYLIDLFLNRFGFRKYFSVIYSAENEPYGKPHPGVYLKTANLLNCNTTECLAIEDSFHGMIAAKAAKMKVIVLPERSEADDRRYDAADQKISSLREINKTIFEKINN